MMLPPGRFANLGTKDAGHVNRRGHHGYEEDSLSEYEDADPSYKKICATISFSPVSSNFATFSSVCHLATTISIGHDCCRRAIATRWRSKLEIKASTANSPRWAMPSGGLKVHIAQKGLGSLRSSTSTSSLRNPNTSVPQQGRDRHIGGGGL